MSKKLILQGPDADQATLARIAALAQPRTTTARNSHALRCDGIDFSPELKAAVEAAAFIAGVTSMPSQRSACGFSAVVLRGWARAAMRASAAWSAPGPCKTSFMDMIGLSSVIV